MTRPLAVESGKGESRRANLLKEGESKHQRGMHASTRVRLLRLAPTPLGGPTGLLGAQGAGGMLSCNSPPQETPKDPNKTVFVHIYAIVCFM